MLDEDIGEFRSILASPPSDQVFGRLVRALDQKKSLSQELLTYLSGHLDQWPADVPRQNEDWVLETFEGQDLPTLQLCNGVRQAFEEDPSKLLLSPHLRALEELWLWDVWEEEDWLEPLMASHATQHLGVLGITSASVDDAQLETLANWKGLGSVHTLRLSTNAFTDRGVEALAASPHTRSIRELYLQCNAISSEGVEALMGSESLTQLEVLDLRLNPVGLAGAEAIASAPRAANLSWLYLGEGDISPGGTRVLKNSPYLRASLRDYFGAQEPSNREI